MSGPTQVGLDAVDAETLFERFRDGVCAGKSRRYAMLVKGADGVRCKLQNSGRCLDPDTPWRMVRFVAEPLFRFDPATEWVAIFPVDNWKAACDAAVAESLRSGRDWTVELSDTLANGWGGRPRLMITR